MVSILEAIKAEGRAYELEWQAKLSGRTPEEIIEIARTHISTTKCFDRHRLCSKKIIENKFKDPRHSDEVINFASTKPHWFKAVRDLAIEYYHSPTSPTPEAILQYFGKIELGLEKKPRGRPGRKSSNHFRDQAICECIHFISKYTDYNADKNIATEFKVTAISLVSDAFRTETTTVSSLSYESVRDIWKRRRQIGGRFSDDLEGED